MTINTIRLAAAALCLAVLGLQGEARAQTSDFYMGQLQQFGTAWCPSGWARADGGVYAISQHSALFSLLGTRYGGNGVTTFAVPDLRDRMPIGASNVWPAGTVTGQSSVSILPTQMPAHTHGFYADPTAPVSNSPANSMMGVYPATAAVYAPANASPNVVMNPMMIAPAGGSLPLSTQTPVLATNWCIALTGTFPVRP